MAQALTVLHATEAYGGGVGTAIDEWRAATPDIEHHLLYMPRDGCDPGVLARACFATENRATNLPGFASDLRAAVSRIRPDIVHLHSTIAGAIGRTVLRRKRAAIVYSPHCFYFERTDLSALTARATRTVERLLAGRTSLAVCVSPREVELARELGMPAEYVPNRVTVPVGVPRSAFPRTEQLVLGGGRIVAQKDPSMFAAVAARVRAQLPDARFEWIGGGEEGLREQLERSGVTVSGWRPRREFLERLADAEVYLHTAAWEGHPMTLVEAEELGVRSVVRSIPATDSLGYRQDLTEAIDLAAEVIRALRHDDAPSPGPAAEVPAASSLADAYQRAVGHR